MTLPAATITSQCAHGGVVTMGHPTCLVAGKPVALLGHAHVCPMATPGVPPIPHVGGPIASGAFTVLVGGTPMARVTDIAICVGPPDTIAVGAPNVLVGQAGGGGAAGALRGLALAGRSLVARFTGGSAPAALVSGITGISVAGTPAFRAAIAARLGEVGATPAGQAVIDRLHADGRHLVIAERAEHADDGGAASADEAWLRHELARGDA